MFAQSQKAGAASAAWGLSMACGAWLATACGGSTGLADDGRDDDAETDSSGALDDGGDDAADPDTADAQPEIVPLDASGWEASEYVVLPPPTSTCGDGVLDPGEECDDGNRLDGDGCDWLCHAGDGDPPPAPDPGATDYVPAGPATPLPDAADGSHPGEYIPLVWTGTEFATVFLTLVFPSGESALMRFRRFDSSGRRIDAEWPLPVSGNFGGADLVWIGDGFGLFFAEVTSGLWYLRLDADGKPLGHPVLIEGEPRARSPAADLAPDGTLAVAWAVDHSDLAGGVFGCTTEATLELRRLELSGERIGSVTVVGEGDNMPDLAAGSDGFGLVFVHRSSEDHHCDFRFIKLDPSLEHPVYSGSLSADSRRWGNVKWVASQARWVTAWMLAPASPSPPPAEARVAWFEMDGSLAGPPVRNVLIVPPPGNVDSAVRLAAGDGGLFLVAGETLRYLRTDSAGCAIAPLREVYPEGVVRDYPGTYSGFNTVWDGEGFAVLFDYAAAFSGGPPSLHLRLFGPAE